MLIGKDDATRMTHIGPQWWAGKDVVIEAYGFVHDAVSYSLRSSNAQLAASHFHAGVAVAAGTRDIWAQALVMKVDKECMARGLWIPGAPNPPSGCAGPSSVEIILEGVYPGKALCTAERAGGQTARAAAFAKSDWSKAVVLPDCAVEVAAETWRSRGVTVTAPAEAEADATLALRAHQGSVVVVNSEDSDILMYPGFAGCGGSVVFPGPGASLLRFDPAGKVAVMSKLLDTTAAQLEQFGLLNAECMYLAIAIASGQDFFGYIFLST